MSRDRLTRMDVDTGWAYHRKLRKLQRLYPERWPVYWAAYMALLGEAWAVGNRRLTLEEAWCPALPCTVEEASEALTAAGIVDRANRIPPRSWTKWYAPAAERMQRASERGKAAADKRWHGGNAAALPTQSNGDAPRQPTKPRQPRAPAREDAGLSPISDAMAELGKKFGRNRVNEATA